VPECADPKLLLLSASSAKALQLRADNLKEYVATKAPRMADLAFTLAARREHLAYRTFVISDHEAEFDTSKLQIRQSITPVVTFVFTGQGAQWAGMGKDLLDAYQSFSANIHAMDRALQALPEPPAWLIEGSS
jgi:acyl transferase domain-containing protein